MPKISIIMRTKNNEDILSEALSSLFQQTEQDFELLIVDSGSVDKTLEIARHYPHRLISIAPEDYFPGKVLNAAAEVAEGEFLVFQNSDVVLLHPEALSELIAPLQRNDSVCGTFARQLPRPEAHLWVKADYAKAFPAQPHAPAWMTYSLPFAAMRKSTWMDFPFYTWAWGSEDTEWGLRQRQRDARSIVYVPTAEVMHSHNYTLPQIYGRRYIEGEADAWMQRAQQGLFQRSALKRWIHKGVRVLLQSTKDSAEAFTQGKYNEALHIFARRLWWEWAHEKGFRQGLKRLKHHPDHLEQAHKGQQIVLQSHPSRQ